MSLHETRRSPTRRIDDSQLLQGLLTQRLYVNEHDRLLLRVLLAETPPQQRPLRRTPRRGARRLRAGGAALALSGVLALALSSPMLTAVAASPAPASWVAVTDRATATLASPADDALMRALLNHAAIASQATAPTDQSSDALLRALLNRTAASQATAPADQSSDVLLRALLNRAAASQVIAPAEQANDVLLRALLNRTTTSQAAAPAEQANDVLLRALLNRTTTSQVGVAAEQAAPQADAALAQAELNVGETLIIPAVQLATDATAAETPAANANLAPLADTVYIVQPGDTLSGIAWAFYGNGNFWPTIFNANSDTIANPHWIYPNQQFVIPGAVYTASTTNPTYWSPNPSPNVHSGSAYTVVWGDTLSGLAYAAYGNGNAWWGIFQANTNQISNPNLIYPGQVLTIP